MSSTQAPACGWTWLSGISLCFKFRVQPAGAGVWVIYKLNTGAPQDQAYSDFSQPLSANCLRLAACGVWHAVHDSTICFAWSSSACTAVQAEANWLTLHYALETADDVRASVSLCVYSDMYEVGVQAVALLLTHLAQRQHSRKGQIWHRGYRTSSAVRRLAVGPTSLGLWV